jgi:hypothetical protein
MTLLWHPISSKLDVLMKVTNADTILASVRVNAQRNWRSGPFSKLSSKRLGVTQDFAFAPCGMRSTMVLQLNE